ncbi:putative Ig domain-containing protein, partial [Agrobacterium albertimagni AOL15]
VQSKLGTESGENGTTFVIEAATGQVFSEADIKAIINHLRFFVDEKTPQTSPDRTLQITLTDNGDGTTNAGVNSNTFEVTIAVTGVNDTPNDNRSNAVSVATAEDTGIADLTSLMRTTFGGSQNPYNFVDQDDDTNDLGGTPAQMTLSVAHGTLTFTDGSGLTVVSGNGTGAIVVQGSVANLNSFINGGGAANVSYQPNT